MDPTHYLLASYYERVLTGVATLLVEKGVVTREELEHRAGGPFPLANPVADRPTADLQPQPEPASPSAIRWSSEHHPAGHTRVPRYVRGKRGDVVKVAPSFSFPDAAAHGQPQRSEHTYHVEFAPGSCGPMRPASNESVVVDLWDSYLEGA